MCSLTPKGKAAILSDNDGQISVSHADVFFHAIRGGDLAAVQRMLAAEPDLSRAKSEQGVSPLLTAVYSGRNEIRDLLLSLDTPLDLHEAAATGNLERVQQFIDKNPQRAKEYSTDGFPVVALAAVFGHSQVVHFLFENGADVNAAAVNGTEYNALTGAVASGHFEIVAWLLAHGADANYRYGAGYSPSITAAANGTTLVLNMGRPDVAAESLDKIRKSLSDLRRENKVTVLADCVLDANVSMDALFALDGKADWESLSAGAESYRGTLRRCDGIAGERLRGGGEFRRLIDGALASLAQIPKAVCTAS